jgi:hypothetical protein
VRAAIVKRDAGPHQETISVGRDLDRARSPARAIKPAKVSSHAIVPVTEMLHRRLFRNLRSPCSTIVPIFLHKTVADREMAQAGSKGWCDARIVGT